MQRYREAATKMGRDDIAEAGNLLYDAKRIDVVYGLRARGWDATGVGAEELMARHDRFVAADLQDATPQSVFVDHDCADARLQSARKLSRPATAVVAETPMCRLCEVTQRYKPASGRTTATCCVPST
jgi:hypothetical protein